MSPSGRGRSTHVFLRIPCPCAITDTSQPGDDFKKRNIFRAHTLEPYSPDEEKEVRITSLHWVKRRKKVKSALIISFMFHGVKYALFHSFPSNQVDFFQACRSRRRTRYLLLAYQNAGVRGDSVFEIDALTFG